MREISEEYKMTARCPWEVRDILRDIEAWTARDKSAWQVHRDDGGTKAPTNAAILSAVLFWFRSLPVDQQADAIRVGMARLNALILPAPSIPAIPHGHGQPSEPPAAARPSGAAPAERKRRRG